MTYRDIYVGGGLRPRHRIRDSLLYCHLPDIAASYPPAIDLLRVARSVSSISNGRLSEQQAFGPLKWFCARAEMSDTKNIHRDVKNHLENMSRRCSAIHKIRKHFTTMAYLSNRAGSTTIPPYLISFFMDMAEDIIANDYHRLSDWEHAIGKLRNLAPTSAALKELAHGRNRRTHYGTHFHRPYGASDDSDDGLGLNLWERGRALGRVDRRHRSRTMPPMYYPPVTRIAAPNYLALPASRGIMSGFPSPSLFAHDPWREAEMDDIREHQMLLADQVNQLALGQQALEDEVQVQAQAQAADTYGPRLIGYP